MRVAARFAPVVGLAAALVLLTAVPAQGTPILTVTVTPAGGLLHYDYSILFDPADDEIAFFTIKGVAGDSSLVNEVAPAGYDTDYDIGNGFISFFPEVGFSFPRSSPNGPLSGFGFDTDRRPGQTMFETIPSNPDILTTIGPVGATIPEPATILLLATGLGVLGRRSVRKRT